MRTGTLTQPAKMSDAEEVPAEVRHTHLRSLFPCFTQRKHHSRSAGCVLWPLLSIALLTLMD